MTNRGGGGGYILCDRKKVRRTHSLTGGGYIKHGIGDLILSLIVAVIGGCSDPGTSTILNGIVKIEVDMQSGQDPFGLGESNVKSVFPGCAKPIFELDQTDLEEEMIEYSTSGLWDYFMDHRKMLPIPMVGSVYPYYLCGISQFKDSLSEVPIDFYAGLTAGSQLHETFSYVCRAVTDQVYPQSIRDEYRMKVCCHELGHQLALLVHLCTASGLFDNNNHSDESCLMGQSTIQQCGSGEDLLQYIHFCETCLARLCRAKGIEEL